MLIKSASKFRIYPTEAQQAMLTNQFGQARFVYNHFLTIRKQHYFENGQGLSYNQTSKMLTELKRTEGFEWLKAGNAQVQQQSLRNLETAYQNYFKMVQEGTLPKGNGKCRKDRMPKGYPSYHSRHDEQSITIPQNFQVEGSRFYLPKVGWIRTIFHRPLEGATKGFVVSKTKTGKYFVTIKVEKEVPEPEFCGPQLGIDLGLTHFAILSTSEKIEHPQFFRQAEKRIQRAHRAVSRKKKGSGNREKARHRLAREYEKVNNRRLNFLHQKTNRLTKAYGHIKIENLNVQGMVQNHSLAKSIQDSGWGEFARQLEYKGQLNGCRVARIDRFYPSSKLCNVCHFKNDDLKPHHRFWTCPECGTEHDRDVNAAINILAFGAPKDDNGTVGATGTAFPTNGKGTPVETRTPLGARPRKPLAV